MKNNIQTKEILNLLENVEKKCAAADEKPAQMILNCILGALNSGPAAEILLMNKLAEFTKDVLMPLLLNNQYSQN